MENDDRMSDAPVTLDIEKDIIGTAVKRVYVNFRVALPAAAMSFDRDLSQASAAFRVRFIDTALGVRDEPTAPSVPVLHYSAGGYGVWFDPDDGDPMLVVACDGPVSGYYETGDSVTPTTGQSHDFGCAVALMGGRFSSPSAPTPPPNNAGEAVVGAADGSATLTLRRAGKPSPDELGSATVAVAGPEASLLLGGPQAADPVACANEVQANLAALNTAIAATPTTGNAIADLAVNAIKAVVLTWSNALQPMGDLKSRVEGPVPLPP